ncbi:kinase-like protein [Trametes sanguinea]|nr:kinase-like protein [Trametes sanguinea]
MCEDQHDDAPVPLGHTRQSVVIYNAPGGGVFDCEEEPHMIKHPKARGYMPLHLGDTLNDGKYEVVRKLSYAVSSSVWMTLSDHSIIYRQRPDWDPKYAAMKVLNANATLREALKGSYELDALLRMKQQWDSDHPGLSHCVRCYDVFFEKSVHGRHMCMAFTLCGTTLDDLLDEQPLGTFSLPVVKRFVKQALLALDFLHTQVSIVHCDVKLANFFVQIDADDAVISKYLQEHPSESYPTRYHSGLWDGPIITVKSQPLPNFGLDPSLSNLNVVIGDFGGGTIKAFLLEDWDPKADQATPLILRAPEQILEGAWSTPVDIWMIGCMTFVSLTATNVFELYHTSKLDETDVHLARIVEHIGPFPAAFLERCDKRTQYFDDTGRLLKTALPNGGPLENRLSAALLGTLGAQDFRQTAAFIRRCLTIDPNERPTAAQLLEDEWFAS